MKLTTLLLQEAKQVGDLYHFTFLPKWNKIKEENRLIGSSMTSDLHYSLFTRDPEVLKTKKRHTPIEGYFVSLTRNPTLYKELNLYTDLSARGPSEVVPIVRICINGSKLSNKYKIIPYNYFSNSKQIEKDEFEERVILDSKTPYITNLSNYVFRVDLLEFKTMTSKLPKVTLNFDQI